MTVGRSSSPTHRIGAQAEMQALAIMQAQGYQLVAQNYHSRFGEIDLIMSKGNMLVFAEVKARQAQGYGSVFDTVTASKQAKIRQTADLFLANAPDYVDFDCRFDVIGITLSKRADQPPQIEWLEAAF